MPFDLLTTVIYGGCSAKLPAAQLAEALKHLPVSKDPRLLVDISTHDDAGVFKISDDIALIQTNDFFPPVCSDPRTFGRIAAANALSDVYAMGGTALTALNIVCFPSQKIPLEALSDMLAGGQDKVAEADAVIVGGHTIDDFPPKYGLAVTGIVHPDRIITNAAARAGDHLILTKPLGTGVIIAGKRLGEADEHSYAAALASMELLNKNGAAVMQRYNVKCATDITGFGLLGHATKMAQASRVTFLIRSREVPLLPGAYAFAEAGYLPGACFRNQEFTDPSVEFTKGIDYTRRMLLFDAQTSGGLFLCVPQGTDAGEIVQELRQCGYPDAAVIGEAVAKRTAAIVVE
jgi:selenide,water dikinase